MPDSVSSTRCSVRPNLTKKTCPVLAQNFVDLAASKPFPLKRFGNVIVVAQFLEPSENWSSAKIHQLSAIALVTSNIVEEFLWLLLGGIRPDANAVLADHASDIINHLGIVVYSRRKPFW